MVSKSSSTFRACLLGSLSALAFILPACGGQIAPDEMSSDEMAAAPDESADPGVEAIGQLGQPIFSSYDVGVIPSHRSCPGGTDAVRIAMDDEDRRNANRHGGYTGATISNSNTDFLFCRVDGRNLFPLVQSSDIIASHYAVLKLGEYCPNGSLEFTRSFDNEDKNNKNTAEGNIYPNSSDRASSRTNLVFCLFRGGETTMAAFPDTFPGLDRFGYGVFAQSTFSQRVLSGFVYTDDEDNNNNLYFADIGWIADAQRIITHGSNTTLNIAGVVPVVPSNGSRHYTCGYALPGYGCNNGRMSARITAADMTSAINACFGEQPSEYSDFCHVIDADGATESDVTQCEDASASWRPGNSCCNFAGSLSCPG